MAITFAQSLKSLMDEKRVKQKELADAVGLSQTMISNYLSDEVEPGIGTIIKISKYFNVGVDHFYPELPIGKAPKKPEPNSSNLVEDYRVYNKHLIFENENLWDERKRMWSIIEQHVIPKTS